MTNDVVSLERLIARVKAHPDISRAGMILCHNGIVREVDRTGTRHVSKLKVTVDDSEIEVIRQWARSQPGIVTAEAEAFEGELHVGDDLLYVVVAGDYRENVFAIMREIIERVKAKGVRKTEMYSE